MASKIRQAGRKSPWLRREKCRVRRPRSDLLDAVKVVTNDRHLHVLGVSVEGVPDQLRNSRKRSGFAEPLKVLRVKLYVEELHRVKEFRKTLGGPVYRPGLTEPAAKCEVGAS
ncbi:MAG TPA: hypothetical protein VFJ57_14320 [Solirubrobacterales bacterium]|nr:hypothetical protein [Solirubrobacterales bacterium]